MTDSLLRVLNYLPEMEGVVLMTQYGMRNALTPLMMDSFRTWKEFSFLLTCPTAELSREVWVPDKPTDTEADQLLEFFSNRPPYPLRKLILRRATMDRMTDRIRISGRVPDLTADIYYLEGINMVLPDSTLELVISGGRIQNIPSKLRTLEIHDAFLDETIMNSIREAECITSLTIHAGRSMHNPMFRGFPPSLQKLDIQYDDSLTYAEVPAIEILSSNRKTGYECYYLRHLKICGSRPSRQFPRFPQSFIESIANTLTSLHISGHVCDGTNYIAEILPKFVALEELRIDKDVETKVEIPPWIMRLSLEDIFVMSSSNGSSLPELRELRYIRGGGGRDEVLLSSPKLEMVSLSSLEPSLQTRAYPSVKTVVMSQLWLYRNALSWIPIPIILASFPNITSYRYLNGGLDWDIDFTERSIRFCFLISRLVKVTEPELSLVESNFEKIHITLDRDVNQSYPTLSIVLPPTTKELSFSTIPIRRRGETGSGIEIHDIKRLCDEGHIAEPSRIVVAISRTQLDINIVGKSYSKTLCEFR